jgi:hypothetical protein
MSSGGQRWWQVIWQFIVSGLFRWGFVTMSYLVPGRWSLPSFGPFWIPRWLQSDCRREWLKIKDTDIK